MPLDTGARLGPYEVLAPLGAGGMGEVYRARDTRLNREVALKVLPQEFAAQPDRRKRFEQEARAVAALNHPNIVAVYDVGEDYFVTELVDGESLRGAGFGLRKTIDIAAQIADGLAAAHSAGITHRDLKPENVMVTREGRAKILDFGLARQEVPSSGAAPTLTEPGVAMGTVGYMSPEQVRGQIADSRSDIFSFGGILYELLAGKRAFQRVSPAETMAAIARDDPPELPPGLPSALQQILLRCLEKEPQQRFQSASDLAFALRSIVGSGTVAAVVPPGIRKPRTRLLKAAGFLVGLLAAVFFAATRMTPPDPPQYHRLTFRRGFIRSARFAPEANTVVYSAAWEGKDVEIFTTRVDNPESRPLGIRGAHVESISSRGDMALLITGDGSSEGAMVLARAPLAGGAPRELARDIATADWTPDGAELVAVRAVSGNARIEWPLGKPVYETSGLVGGFRVSPKGDRLAFGERSPGLTSAWTVSTLDKSGNKQPLPGRWPLEHLRLAWRDTGQIWLEMGTYAGTNLSAVSLAGQARLLQHTLAPFRLMDIGPDGRVLVARQIWRVGILGVAPGGTGETDFSWLDASEVDDISPDGKNLLITEYGEGGGVENWSVYLRKTDGSPAVRLGDGQACALSPDGALALTLRRGSPPKLVLLPTGAGETVELKTEGFVDFRFGTWLPDGKRIVFDGNHREQGRRLWLMDISGGQPRAITPQNVILDLGQHTVSPDGASVAAWGPDGKVYLYPTSGGNPVPIPQFFRRGDRLMRFSSDGRFLFGLRTRVHETDVMRLDLAGGRTEVWKKLRPADPAGITSISPAHISRDGKSYFYNYTRQLSDLYLLDGLR